MRLRIGDPVPGSPPPLRPRGEALITSASSVRPSGEDEASPPTQAPRSTCLPRRLDGQHDREVIPPAFETVMAQQVTGVAFPVMRLRGQKAIEVRSEERRV